MNHYEKAMTFILIKNKNNSAVEYYSCDIVIRSRCKKVPFCNGFVIQKKVQPTSENFNSIVLTVFEFAF